MVLTGMLCEAMGPTRNECTSDNNILEVGVARHQLNPATAAVDPFPDWFQPFTECFFEEPIAIESARGGSTQEREPAVPLLA